MTGDFARRGFLLRLVAGAALLFLAAGCGGGSDEEAAPDPRTPVRVRVVERRSFTDYFEVVGTAKGEREATLVFEVGGVVEEILAEKGQAVGEGGAIARLNDDLLAAALEEAKAARDLAVELHERSVALKEKGGISEYELSSLEHKREMAEARFRTAQAQHDRTVLRAPFEGVVDLRFLDVGDYANPMAPFVRFLDLRRMKVEMPIPEVYLGRVRVGDVAEVRADPYPGRLFEGKVRFVSREVDKSSRTITVEVGLSNEDGALRPGMTLRVRLQKEAYENAVVVPQDAVVETETGSAVFLAQEGSAVQRLVALGPVYGQMAVIDSGLAVGESLIVVGNRDLVDGEKIEVLP